MQGSDLISAVKFIIEIVLKLASWFDQLFKAIIVPIMNQIGIKGDAANAITFIIELMIFVVLIEKAAGLVKWVLLALLILLVIGALYPYLPMRFNKIPFMELGVAIEGCGDTQARGSRGTGVRGGLS
jgi:hypothetical protein